MRKFLNLYAGIGGNRKLLEDVEVTAIEYDPDIARIYHELYPNDKVIVVDAHQYLLEHFKEYDYIWASPPCPSHSTVRKMGCNPRSYEEEGQNKPMFPDMKLYEEIIFLKYYYKGKFCIENVMPYYKPLIPAKKLDRHLFWTNYPLNVQRFNIKRKHDMTLQEFEDSLGVNIRGKIDNNKLRMIYRNCVDSMIGKFCYDMAFNQKQLSITTFEGEMT